ncbi:MAG: gamma-glutamyltransferase [Planctomycetota bacterium]
MEPAALSSRMPLLVILVTSIGLFMSGAHATELSKPGSAVVVAAHPAAAEAGIAVLAQGGNAVDAAVATALTLGVAEPWGSGLGGKVVLLFHHAETGKTYCIEALDQAGDQLDTQRFIQRPRAQRAASPHAVAIPGMLAGWGEAHARWGTQPWADLVQPAIDAAENGVLADRYDTHAARVAVDKLTAGGLHPVFFPNGSPPSPGQPVTYPDLGQTLRTIQAHGPRSLYEGPLAERIADHLAGLGSDLTVQDFAQYQPAVHLAPSVTYRGHSVYTGTPPATGGATLLLALETLQRLHPQPIADPASRVDAMARALYLIYPKVRRTLGGRGPALQTLQEHLTPHALDRLARAAADLDPSQEAQALAARLPHNLPTRGCTSHFIVADAHGNVVSATQSLGHHFGSGVTVPGTGIVFNTTMVNFAVRTPSSPNYAGPGLRPRSTMTPVIALRNGQPVLALGGAGGQRIPTMVLRALSEALDGQNTLDQAIHQPRAHVLHAISGLPRLEVHLEPGPDAQALHDQLERRGWRPQILPGRKMYFGGMNGITRNADGQWIGIGDDRRTNAARVLP